MKKIGLIGLVLGVLSLLFVSCEKIDQPVSVPQKSGSEYEMVEMGEDYTNQIFYDLESHKVVFVSPIKSWDLAFETSVTGYHVFMNGGGRNIYTHNTHSTDIKSVLTAPKLKDNEWDLDQSCGSPDSTGIGEWLQGGISKNEVYILKLDPFLFPDTFKKIQLVSVSGDSYVFMYGDLKSTTVKTIIIPKKPEYNYTYFSFETDGIVMPEPPKTTWDIVFTRYRYVYHELNNFSYPVNGVLLNPYNTTCGRDSTTPYEKIQSTNLLSMTFTNVRDAIGFDWKFYNRDQAVDVAKYVVNRNKIYIIKTQKDEYWKLHFLDFYNSQGVKGSPSFEYERLQ